MYDIVIQGTNKPEIPDEAERMISMSELEFNPVGTTPASIKGKSIGYFFKDGPYKGKHAILRSSIVTNDNSMKYLVEVEGEGVETLIPEKDLLQRLEFIGGN
jgi:hypothetical protein